MKETAQSGHQPQIIGETGVAGLFLILTLAAFFPLPLRMVTSTLLGRVDKYIFIWDLWWVRTALASADTELFFTTRIFHPEGAGLVFHTLFPLGGLLSIPLQALGGLIFSFNALTILATALSGWFTYLLARELFGTKTGRLPAVLAGIIFAFCPARWTSTFLGHLNLVSNQWIPLYLLFLVRLFRRGRPRDGAAAGLWAAMILYTGYQQLVFTVYWSALILVPLWPEIRLREHWRRYLAGLGLLVLVLGILGTPVILGALEQREGAVVRFEVNEARGLALSLQQIVLTHPIQRFWHPAPWTAWLRGEHGRPALPAASGVTSQWKRSLGGFLGFGPIFGFSTGLILLSGLLLPRRRGNGFGLFLAWLIPPVFFAWMALGPHPTFFGIPFPGLYNRFFPVPVLGAVRGVYRFAIPMMLGIGLAAALSCRGWLEYLQGRASAAQGRRPLAAALVLVQLLPALVYLDFLRIPIPLERLPEPPAVYRSADFRTRFAGSAVLELPLWVSGADFRYGEEHREHLWYQTIHGLPQVGGHVSRLTENQVGYFTRHPSLMRLTRTRGTDGYDMETGTDLRLMAEEFGVGVITVSRGHYSPEAEGALLRFLEQWLALEELEQSRRFTVFAVRLHGFSPSTVQPSAAVEPAGG